MAEIVMNYSEANENNFGKLKRQLIENQKIFQYVYASAYLKVYSFVEKIGVDKKEVQIKKILNLKSGKIEKNILKNQLTNTFPSSKIRHHLRCGSEKTCYK